MTMHAMVTVGGLTLRAAPDGAGLGALVHGDRLEVLGIAQPGTARWWYVRVLAARAKDNVALIGYIPAQGPGGVDTVRIDRPPGVPGRLTTALRLGALTGRLGLAEPWTLVPVAAWIVGSLAAAAILLYWAISLAVSR
jgi:hypothetical protein